MEREQQPDPPALTAIHINLEERAIEFEDAHGTIGRLLLDRAVVLYEGAPLQLGAEFSSAPTDRSTSEPTSDRPRPPDYLGQLDARTERDAPPPER